MLRREVSVELLTSYFLLLTSYFLLLRREANAEGGVAVNAERTMAMISLTVIHDVMKVHAYTHTCIHTYTYIQWA